MRNHLKKQLAAAEKLIQEKNLVINHVEYEILAVSLHTKWDAHNDPFAFVDVNTKRKFQSWFSYDKDYLKYLDFDITNKANNNTFGGIRIICIQSVDDPSKIYKTTGAVYDFIVESIGYDVLNKYSSKKSLVHKRSTPLLYFTKKATPSTRKIYNLPRYANFLKSDFKDSEYNKYKFIYMEKMVTNSLDWLKGIEHQLSQIKPITINLTLKGEKNFLIENKIIKENLLSRHLQYFENGKAMNAKPRFKNLNIETLSTLYGYFSSNDPDLISE